MTYPKPPLAARFALDSWTHDRLDRGLRLPALSECRFIVGATAGGEDDRVVAGIEDTTAGEANPSSSCLGRGVVPDRGARASSVETRNGSWR